MALDTEMNRDYKPIIVYRNNIKKPTEGEGASSFFCPFLMNSPNVTVRGS